MDSMYGKVFNLKEEERGEGFSPPSVFFSHMGQRGGGGLGDPGPNPWKRNSRASPHPLFSYKPGD